jgi:hypothetical protein
MFPRQAEIKRSSVSLRATSLEQAQRELAEEGVEEEEAKAAPASEKGASSRAHITCEAGEYETWQGELQKLVEGRIDSLRVPNKDYAGLMEAIIGLISGRDDFQEASMVYCEMEDFLPEILANHALSPGLPCASRVQDELYNGLAGYFSEHVSTDERKAVQQVTATTWNKAVNRWPRWLPGMPVSGPLEIGHWAATLLALIGSFMEKDLKSIGYSANGTVDQLNQQLMQAVRKCNLPDHLEGWLLSPAMQALIYALGTTGTSRMSLFGGIEFTKARVTDASSSGVVKEILSASMPDRLVDKIRLKARTFRWQFLHQFHALLNACLQVYMKHKADDFKEEFARKSLRGRGFC